MQKIIHILGTRVNIVTCNDVFDFAINTLKSTQKKYITTLNPEILINGYRNEKFRRILNDGDLNIPDGIGLTYMSKVGKLLFGFNEEITTRVTGVDLCTKLIDESHTYGYSIFFLGASEESNAGTVAYARTKNAHIAGSFSGNYDDLSQIDIIRNSHPDLILIAYGSPKQETWIAKNIENLPAKLLIGIGGSFDFISHSKRRAPKLMMNIGLEWLYRVIQEPKRIFRILNATVVFPTLYILDSLRTKFKMR